MDGNIVGLAAVVMVFGIPMAAMYTFFRVRKLRSEERLAAIARGDGSSHATGTLGSGSFAALGNSAGGRGNRLYRDLRSDRTTGT